jgi:ubiquinone/menaquinone biosynthesis C-methylase UbiE
MKAGKWSARWPARLYVWATYRLYHELAWAYDLVAWLVSLGHWSRWRRMALEHLSGQRVLEVGFGTGELLSEMARQGLAVWGLDYSAEMQRITAHKLDRRCLGVPRVRAVTQALPFSDASFDTVVSTFPAGYIFDPATLHEIARVLGPPAAAPGATPGGRLVVVGLVLQSKHRFVRWILGVVFGTSGEKVLERFQQLATEAGLRVTVKARAGKLWRIPVIIAER